MRGTQNYQSLMLSTLFTRHRRCARVGGALLVLHARVRNAWSNRTGGTAGAKFTQNLRFEINLPLHGEFTDGYLPTGMCPQGL